MAFTVSLTHFAKSKNSTKIPSSFSLSIDGTLKENSGVSNPTISFNMGVNSPASYNYAYIATFSRYYYINEWVYVYGGVWEASMAVDVMATCKAIIGASSQYVERSSVDVVGSIIDTMYQETGYVTKENSVATSPFQAYDSGDYTIILGIIGRGDSNNRTGINYYVLTATAFATLLNALFGNNDYFGISEISFNLVKALANPSDYITTCKLFPFTVAGSGSVNIKCGWWDSEVNSPILTGNSTIVFNRTLTIPKHPQASTRGSYLNVSSAKYALFCPLFGTIPLNPAILADETTLNLGIKVDLISGLGTLTVVTVNNTPVEKVTAMIATEVPIGQVSQDFVGAFGSAVSGAVGASSGNPLVAMGGLTGALLSLVPQVRVSGTMGTTSAYSESFILSAFFSHIVDGDNAHEGKPCFKVMTIGNAVGYYKCRNVKIETGLSDAENEEVRNTMEEGFYYE